MPKLLKFFLLLIAFSLPLFYLWMEGGQTIYQKIFGAAVVPLAKALGEKTLNLFVVKGHLMNLIPFTALILATPGLGWKRRIIGLGAGLVILFGWHLFFCLILNHYQTLWGHDRRFYRLFIPAVSVNSAVPVMLWFILAWKGVRQLLGEIFSRPKEPQTG